jgi:tRNA A-37 threonylcarbamoyl transferase component Bud32
MSIPRICSECGSSIPPSSRDNRCPRCLFGLALGEVGETQVMEQSRGNDTFYPAGHVFGDYELLGPIGQGGMGVVYKARQRTPDRIVALKLNLSGLRATETEIKRFHTESSAAAKLQHPNIVAIHEVGKHEGRHYFSMDYIEGASLADVINRTPLSGERAARYVKIIAEAIHYAHERGILHRDLKPHNILIDAKDEPRITDFGLARQIDVDSDLTVSGVVLGTPSYMPPEQATGNRREIGPAIDVYSMGAILYDGLTGRPPFRADTLLDTLRQVKDTEPAPPRLLNRKVPRDLETICLKCLSKAPNQRYPSAQELADDLGRFLRHEPIQARPVGRFERLWRWSRRNPLLAAGCAGIALGLFMLAGAAWVLRADAEQNAKEDASLTARLVHNELKPLSAAVSEVAARKELTEDMANGDTDALGKLLKATLERHQVNAPSWLHLQNWVIMRTNGELIVRWPEAGTNSLMARHERDYFKGAMKLAGANSTNPVYFSRGYKSVEDRLYKFGVSQAIRDERGEPAGVIALMVSTTDFAGTALRPVKPDRREVFLACEWDPWRPGEASSTKAPVREREFQIVFHRTFGTNNCIEAISPRYLEQFAESATLETLGVSGIPDLLAKGPSQILARWQAGFARVRDTHFIVIYETKDRVIDALAIAALMIAVTVLLFFGWRFVQQPDKRKR